MNENKKLILSTVEDLVSDFLYYDRKEDDELPINIIENEIIHGRITVYEIIHRFRMALVNGIK